MDGDVGEFAVLVLMGVAGSGKSALGRRLALRLSVDFVDADDHHGAANRAKMSRGEGLDDADREPWLASLRSLVDAALVGARPAFVLACSALKEVHRDRLGVGLPRVALLHLEVDPPILADRLAKRVGHFAGPSLLSSQLATLERPAVEVWLPGHLSLDELESIALRRLGARGGTVSDS